MIAIIDYGVGNLFSLASSLKYIGVETLVTNKKEDIEAADRIILPGVGAFEDASRKLYATGLVDTLMEQAAAGKPLMGICLGMQLLFERSFEYGEFRGLGLVPGDIVPLEGDISPDLKIPQIGWNSLKFEKDDPLFRYIKEGEYVYFVHGYYARRGENTAATTNYGTDITAVVRKGNVCGTQFHPEKSGSTGLNILRAFSEQ
jgi:imidazole glycerol phosphate synthase, glutamine amidotransferase subunit